MLFIGDLLTLSFWYYYFFKEGYEKEQRIYSYYNNILTGSIFAGICLYFALGLNTIAIISISLINAVLQCYLGYPYYKRHYEAKVEARKAKSDEWIKRLEKVIDFLKDLEEKFDDAPRKADQHEAGTNKQTGDNPKQKTTHPTHIVRVLKAFEMPVTTNDFGLIKSRFRQLIQTHHPDKGGTNEMTARLINDYKILEEYFRENNN
jgi:hypothetical protein